MLDGLYGFGLVCRLKRAQRFAKTFSVGQPHLHEVVVHVDVVQQHRVEEVVLAPLSNRQVGTLLDGPTDVELYRRCFDQQHRVGHLALDRLLSRLAYACPRLDGTRKHVGCLMDEVQPDARLTLCVQPLDGVAQPADVHDRLAVVHVGAQSPQRVRQLTLCTSVQGL
jgi:hypothetical protein